MTLDLELAIRIRAPPPLVWRALTTTPGLEQFWATRANVEVTPGGRFTFAYGTDAAAQDKGRYGAVEAERRLLLEWDQPGGAADPNPVEIVLHPEVRGGTKVELIHHALDEEDEESMEEQVDRWEDVLAGLKDVAERWAEKEAKRAAKEEEDRAASRGGARRGKKTFAKGGAKGGAKRGAKSGSRRPRQPR